MSNGYLLSFELWDAPDTLFIHGDPEGLKDLAEMLRSLAENTPEGYFDHEHLWTRQGLSEQGKSGRRINHVKVYCWRGGIAKGAPDHPLIRQCKSFNDHGYSLPIIREWRAQESAAGRPSSLDDFIQKHGLCVECRARGITFDRSSREPQVCKVCGGFGKKKPES